MAVTLLALGLQLAGLPLGSALPDGPASAPAPAGGGGPVEGAGSGSAPGPGPVRTDAERPRTRLRAALAREDHEPALDEAHLPASTASWPVGVVPMRPPPALVPLPHNGKHSKTKEFKRLAHALGEILSDHHIDENGNVSPPYPNRRYKFSQLDMDNSGAVSLEEVARVLDFPHSSEDKFPLMQPHLDTLQQLQSDYLSDGKNAAAWGKTQVRQAKSGGRAHDSLFGWFQHSGFWKTFHALYDTDGDGGITVAEYNSDIAAYHDL